MERMAMVVETGGCCGNLDVKNRAGGRDVTGSGAVVTN